VLKPAESIIFFEIPLIYAQFFGVLMLKKYRPKANQWLSGGIVN